MSVEQHEFQAEVKQLLDLMIHSLYSHKEVFLRELISNASDAIDKVRFAGVTKPELLPSGEFGIQLIADPESRTLSISDNGIGMNRAEVIENLGTLAKSGSGDFIEKLKQAGGQGDAPELIGQFGVGFYAAFMVADEISVLTRAAGEGEAVLFKSGGGGEYSIEDAERAEAGTTVTLSLKPSDAEDGLSDFSDEWVLRQTVKKYSDFVAYPVRLEVIRPVVEEGAEDKDEDQDKGQEEQQADEEKDSNDTPLNSMKAIWTRPESDVSDDEYIEFYKHITHDFQEPLLRISSKMEGTFEAKSLLYVPAKAPHDLYHREMSHRGIQLYVRRVFIMDECRDLVPDYLRFVRGVVDAEDVSLNVSREILQQDRQIQAIRKYLVKKVLESLKTLRKGDEEKYLRFWAEFGPVLKEGLLMWDEKKDRILDLVLARSTHDDSKLSSLEEYVERMNEDQEDIYYMVGTSIDTLAGSPHLEAFKEKGIEVLLFADPVDEVWLQQMPPQFKGKNFKSAGRGEVDLEADKEDEAQDEQSKQEQESFKDLLQALGSALEGSAKEVRLSKRLKSSPACLVLEEGQLSPQLEAMLRQAGQETPETKPIMEINPEHPLLKRLQEIFEADEKDARIGSYAELLFGQAVLAEGGQLADPTDFSRKLADLMLEAL
ncbi:MAG: molecular chaperone HtpG [Deltaproteobacteria bacterium]|nr:molecular chaperone HtpG [Deltaproteobacteria bacterium]